MDEVHKENNMGRRANGLGNLQGKRKVGNKIPVDGLDYHEGLSANQVKIVLAEFGFDNDGLQRFYEWMDGQTCPVIARGGDFNKVRWEGGVYEHDLFRWIESQKTGRPTVWD